MIRRILLYIFVAVVALPLTAQAFTNALSHVTDPVSLTSLTFLKELVSTQNYAQLGFQSVAEVKKATLGDSLPLRSVRLDRLRVYQASVDPATLLEPANAILYPVVVMSETRSGITLGKAPEGWKPLVYGLPHRTRQWILGRKQLATQLDLPEAVFFGVQIPALNANFLGYYDERNRLMLAPISTDHSLELTKLVAAPASQRFALLVPVAHRYNGMPN